MPVTGESIKEGKSLPVPSDTYKIPRIVRSGGRKGRRWGLKERRSPMARDAASHTSRLVPPVILHNPWLFAPVNQIERDNSVS